MVLINHLRQHKLRWSRLIDSLFPAYRNSGEFIVAGMATMPSRAATFPYAVRSIIRQVDKLYLYLDGFSECPAPARNDVRIVPIFSQDFPNLHANGKLLGLSLEKNPCLYVTVDDDLYYFRKFVTALRSALATHYDAAVVGYHGSILARPLVRYNLNRTIYHYTSGLDQETIVDIVATGAAMFSSDALRFDVRNWPFKNMVDLGMALEAAKAGLPLIAVARRPGETLFALAEHQEDSIFAALKKDDSFQTALARELLRFAAKGERCMSS